MLTKCIVSYSVLWIRSKDPAWLTKCIFVSFSEAVSVLNEFQLKRIQNLIKLTKVFEKPAAVLESGDHKDQNSGSVSETAATCLATTTSTPAPSVSKPPPVDFNKMFWFVFLELKCYCILNIQIMEPFS